MPNFISDSVRRVYIEPPETEDLQNQVAQLEARVESLRRDKNMLMEKCESSLAKATKHAEGEKTARLQAQATQKDVQEMRKKYEAMKAKYQDLKAQKSTPPTHAVKRNSSQAALDTSAVAGPAPEWPSVSDPRRIEIVNNRPMLRIPKRPRIARAPPLDSPTEAVVPPTRPRFVDTTPIIFRRVFRAGHISNRSSPSEDEEEDFSSSASSSSSDEPETVGGREEEDLFVAGHGTFRPILPISAQPHTIPSPLPVAVDPHLVPQYLRPFLLPPFRRIYLNTDTPTQPSSNTTVSGSSENIQQNQMDNERARLRAENAALRTSCLAWRQRADAHAAAHLGLATFARVARDYARMLHTQRDELAQRCESLKRKYGVEDEDEERADAHTAKRSEGVHDTGKLTPTVPPLMSSGQLKPVPESSLPKLPRLPSVEGIATAPDVDKRQAKRRRIDVQLAEPVVSQPRPSRPGLYIASASGR
ncbi:hypothetical protein EW146_g5716 [Bondarzewia mesenterica]|uniref:Uncharacterized protein n=1 Tax=Bondarzewia mesenterica TaxID=1095465 RepID=A0A4S4LSI2_9AGAM|nr:hypothetical protein EW146_g5716 [Bondarzewia mesenterica]